MEKILLELYSEKPQKTLYHYTSLEGLQKIVESCALFATDIQYFNDAAEMKHAKDILNNILSERLQKNNCNVKLLEQLRKWLSDRLVNGHMIFVSSFTTNGNLLSQWRGYCPPGRGISIGFNPDHLSSKATTQLFQIGRCIYNIDGQKAICEKIIDTIEILAEKDGENLDPSKRHPTQSYYGVFEKIESNLLRIAALLKYPSFREEDEWRVVSQNVTRFLEFPILYRVGVSTLVPYVLFSLPSSPDKSVEIEHVYLGPTPNINNSMKSLSNYLSRMMAGPRDGIHYSQIPYRHW